MSGTSDKKPYNPADKLDKGRQGGRKLLLAGLAAVATFAVIRPLKRRGKRDRA